MVFHQLSQVYNWSFRSVIWGTLVFICVAICFWLFYRFNQVFFVLFIAIVIGTVIRPSVNWLHKRGFPRIAAVILIYLLILILFISFVILLFPLIVEQGTTITSAVPGYYKSLREWMVKYPNQLVVKLSDFLPATLPSIKFVQQSGEQIMASAEQVLDYLVSTANIIFISTAMLILAFHWTLDGPVIIQSLLQLVPKDHRESISELITAMETKVGFYITGLGILSLSIGIMALLAYLLIGLPNALVLAVIAGIMEVVPMIGPLIGAIPAAAIALSIAPSKLVWVIVASIFIQAIENNLLAPSVMRKAVGVNPFVSLLALFAFNSLFGIPGALMAIPIAAIIQLLLDHFVFYPEAIEPDISGRDYYSRLRYEAQNLSQDLRKQARFKKMGSDTTVKQIDKVMDEIEGITTDIDALLAKKCASGVL
ncbi:MAG: AI-2E family transporter [Desulfobacterales bacterium]|nr:AI-2E family transporter [Desulfobacterales bacterium]